MNMKIGNPEDKLPAASANNKGRTAPTEAKGKAAAPSGPSQGAAPAAEASAKVALSSQATQLLSGNSAVSSDFDTEKVERIAQAIADHKYEINAPAIADKLLSNAREVLSKTQH